MKTKFYIAALLTILTLTASKCGYVPWRGVYRFAFTNNSEVQVNNMQLSDPWDDGTIYWYGFDESNGFPQEMEFATLSSSQVYSTQLLFRYNDKIVVDTVINLNNLDNEVVVHKLITLNPDLTITIQ